MKKEKIFSKFNTRTYNDKLEEVLENKPFSENVKNNILNMIYKIEEAYNDYSVVKIEVPDEKYFLEKILDVIEKYCNSVEISTTDEIKKKKYIINQEKGSIKVYSNNVWILYSILSLINRENTYKNEVEIIENKPIYDFLNLGHNVNNVEVIRDFNGWSWVNYLNEHQNIKANLIYQNLQLLLGNKNMENFIENIIVNDNNFITKLQNKLERKYNNKKVEKIIDLLKEISITEISKQDTKYKKILLEIKQRKQEELNLMENKKDYLKEITYIKKTNIEIIKGIDKTINNKELLQVEYKLRNSMLKNNEKIFSISYLVDILEKERKEAIEKIAEVNCLMEPKTYIKKKEELENIIKQISVDKKDNYENIIEMQKVFIECFLEDINKATEKMSIINLLYKIRYYINILINENEAIKDVNELRDEVEKLKEKITEKLLKNKLVFEFSENVELNKKVLNTVINTRIINLQAIYIILNINENKIEIYDEDELVEVDSIAIENKDLKNIKANKKMKLFV